MVTQMRWADFVHPDCNGNAILKRKSGHKMPEKLTASLSDSPPMAIVHWLVFMAVMVGLMVVIGGITRLTESGLSMVEWRPLIGALPRLARRNGSVFSSSIKPLPNFRRLIPIWIWPALRRFFSGNIFTACGGACWACVFSCRYYISGCAGKSRLAINCP